MRREEDRPALRAKALHELAHGARRFRIECGGGLVEEHDGGFVKERSRDRELLPHAFRERADRLVAAVPELEQMQITLDLRVDPRGVEVVQPREIAEVLPRG